MLRKSWTVVLGLSLAMASTSSGERPQFTLGGGDVLYGGLVDAGKAARDTTYLLGGPGRLDGKFQDQFGFPDWHGWTHGDATQLSEQRWNVSDFNVPAGGGALAMWCGQHGFAEPCGSGYGNDWSEKLVFTYSVANPTVNTTLGLECIFNYDVEEGYDFFKIQQNRGGTWEDVQSYTGLGSGSFDQDITYTPGDYVGPAANQVEVRFLGVSDNAWSDEDCNYDTNGLAQVDNIRVTIGANVWYEDHEDGDNDSWVQVFDQGVGDFAKIWVGLQDIDLCRSNYTPQVAFIDDGIVVPGTGGTPCVTWCYGPGGYIVNNTGGLAGPEYQYHLENPIFSPILAWPAGADGGILTFDVYQHEDLVNGPSPGMFWAWHVRSTASADPADIAGATWKNRNRVEHGRNYVNVVQNVSDLLVANRTYVQARLQVIEYGWVWGWDGVDGTPAPYFDNVAVKVFPCGGPLLLASAVDLAQDSFSERGEIDLANLANNWVRFDMARNIAPPTNLRNDPGDSILVDIALLRAGSVFNGMPKLVVKMKANPLFDGVRVLPPNFTQNGDIIDGWVYGDSTRQNNGTLVANRYNFDLPDSNFLFPGDKLRYYIEAQDNLAGDVGTATLPADLTGFEDVGYDLVYPGEFIVRALPTLFDVGGGQPATLFWNDAGRSAHAVWYYALGGASELDYDYYETNGPSSGVGNGLGGRATPEVLLGYDVLLYTCGELGVYTLSNGDFSGDPSRDLAVLTNWFLHGEKHAFLTGDDLVQSLTVSGSAGQAFRTQFLGVDLVSTDVGPLIGNQISPRVEVVPGNSLALPSAAGWLAAGGCPGINDFDAVTSAAGTETVARFCNPSGEPDYPYAAAWRRNDIADVVALPYDLVSMSNAPDWNPPVYPPSVRPWFLHEVLVAFDLIWTESAVPDAGTLSVSVHPNPFNPRTTITLVMPRAGDAALKLYDIRGRLVRTLHDGRLAEGRHELIWNGDDDAGRAMASGVYFYEAKAAGEERVGKLTLVR